ncbi:MAG: HAD-IIB family hydrolase [Gemmatimonadota bacterium]|nr:HAD-IIB family hydrolase [Gemmatimonadota bacterium]
MIDLIFIDVDGTLVGSSGEVASTTWEAAARTRAAGVRLAVCSGRPAFGLARGHAERLDGDGWHVFQNGASVVRLPAGPTRSRGLAPAAMTSLVARARGTGRALELYADSEYAVETDTPRTREHAKLLGVRWAPRDLLSLHGPVVRGQWLVSHAEAKVVMAEPHDGLNLSHSLSPLMADTSFINITSAGVDKALAVRAVAAEYDIPLARAMMVGDGANDVTAMQAVGFAVAMGNAEAGAKAVAGYEVSHVDRGGLAEALALALTL